MSESHRSGREASGLFERIRARAAEVARRARFIRIDDEGLERFCAVLDREGLAEADLDPAHEPFEDRETALAYVVTIDALNFGSGWFPVLDKAPGLSGYRTIATRLRERFEAEGPFDAKRLRGFDAEAAAILFGQSTGNAPAMELMEHFAHALRDLGTFLDERMGGRFEGIVEAADGSAARLVDVLQSMPLFRDVSEYQGLEVPLYKRAQITASDLSHAFPDDVWGSFGDLDELTLFADNLVPHVLRCEGVLGYDDALARAIDAEQLIEPGSSEEVEIRAVALHAVERMVESLRGSGHRAITARDLDGLLWNRGQRPEIKAHPRHRARTVFY